MQGCWWWPADSRQSRAAHGRAPESSLDHGDCRALCTIEVPWVVARSLSNTELVACRLYGSNSSLRQGATPKCADKDAAGEVIDTEARAPARTERQQRAGTSSHDRVPRAQQV